MVHYHIYLVVVLLCTVKSIVHATINHSVFLKQKELMSIDINDLLSLQVQQMRVPFWQWYLHQHSMNWRGGIASKLFVSAASLLPLFFMFFQTTGLHHQKASNKAAFLFWQMSDPQKWNRCSSESFDRSFASKLMCATGWFVDSTLLSHGWEIQGFLTESIFLLHCVNATPRLGWKPPRS